MRSIKQKEYKRKFDELRVIINSWNIIPDSQKDEFDSINHLFLSQLYKGVDKYKISKTIQFELTHNYGFDKENIDSDKMTDTVLEWWNNSNKLNV